LLKSSANRRSFIAISKFGVSSISTISTSSSGSRIEGTFRNHELEWKASREGNNEGAREKKEGSTSEGVKNSMSEGVWNNKSEGVKNGKIECERPGARKKNGKSE
jgi:hypothetical protein